MYKIFLAKKAVQQLRRIPEKDYVKIKEKIYLLAKDPYPKGYIKLKGREAFRIRQGNYRIIYEVNDVTVIITVVVIGQRKDIYKK